MCNFWSRLLIKKIISSSYSLFAPYSSIISADVDNIEIQLIKYFDDQMVKINKNNKLKFFAHAYFRFL
jgi:hypothetical protein